MAMGNNPMMMVDEDGMTWGIFKGIANAWDWAWDKGNQFARWADENGIPSFSMGIGMNSGGQINPLVNVNGQEVNFNYDNIYTGINRANQSLSNQLATMPLQKSTYLPLDRKLNPVVWADPYYCHGILEEGGNYISEFNWYDNLNFGKTVWNHWATRAVIPDFISIGGGWSGVFPFGGVTSIEAQWVTRGPEASFYPAITATQGIGVGYSIDATLNIGKANYIGPVDNIRRDMLLSNIGKGDVPTGFVSIGAVAGPKIGVTGTLGKTKDGYIVGRALNVGVGLPAGPVPINGSIGVSNTWLIHDFYNY